ncbi:MAG TPA: hypothetical protein DEA08_08490, partial [Planctomycetes bacterium]|nr:hypothetical protein [Planctomycetota bacterium]
PASLGLEWLEGRWSGTARFGDRPAQRFLADYTSAAGGEVLSASKTLDAKGRAVAFEFERFHCRGGEVVLTPFPGGREAASFPLAEGGPRRAVFRNPSNKWPRELSYVREGERLTIRASGAPGSPVLLVSLERASK